MGQLGDSGTTLSCGIGNHGVKGGFLARNIWAEAYEALKTNPEHAPLLERFKKYLLEDRDVRLDGVGRLLGADGAGNDAEQLKLIQELAKRKLDKFTKSQLTFSVGGRHIVARELFRKIVGVVTKFKDVVGSAISAEPHAAVAWAGVMTILPLLEVAYQQDEDAANGLNEIPFLLVRYQEMQEGFLSLEFQASYQSENSHELLLSIRSEVINVYASIYEYLVRFLLQIKRNKLHKAMRNVVMADNWKDMWKKIEATSQRIDQGVRDSLNTKTRETWNTVNNIRDMTESLLAFMQDVKEEQFLSELPFAGSAVFDSAAVADSGEACLEGTQRRILNDIQDWAEDPGGEQVFWLYGMAGTGKSSVALTAAKALSSGEPFADIGQPVRNAFFGASFFFKKDDTTRNSIQDFFPTIARSLAKALPDLKSYLVGSIKDNPGIGQKAPQQQLDGLIVKPLSALDKQIFPPTRLIIIIDALDECEKPTNPGDLLRMIAALKDLSQGQVQLRILITSRRDDTISRSFEKELNGTHRAVHLDKIELSLTKMNDITLYLTKTLAKIAGRHFVPRECIDQTDVERLSVKADGLFIYAATVCRFLDDYDFGDDECRKECLELIFGDGIESATPQQQIDELYIKVLTSPKIANGPAAFKRRVYEFLAVILGFIAVFPVPVPVSVLTKLLEYRKVLQDTVDRLLGRLHSVVHVPQDRNASLGLIHLSFRDFLFSEERSEKLPFRVQELSSHQAILESCLDIMSSDLHQDMCKLLLPGSLASEVPPSRLEMNIPHYLRYACRYWADHLAMLDEERRKEVGLADSGVIHAFLLKNFLYWLETMSLIRETRNAILIINHIRTLIDPLKHPRLSSLMYDAWRFVLMNKWIIDYAPLQIYCSALLFSPTASIIRSTFESLMPPWITQKPNVPKDWNAELFVLEGHTEMVDSVAFSPNDDLLVSASHDKTIRIWDYVTGTERFRFDKKITSNCAFSRDGNLIAFGSEDGLIEVREFATGGVVELWEVKSVTRIAFSPKCNNILASTSTGGIVRIWDVDTASTLHNFEISPDYYPSFASGRLAFSLDGSLLASVIRNNPIHLWNVRRGELVKTFDANLYHSSISISADGRTVASISIEGIFSMWDISGELLRTTQGGGDIRDVAFSPRDERLIAIVLHDGAIEFRRVDTWDLVGQPTESPTPPNGRENSCVSFSRDGRTLAAGYVGGAVLIWDAEGYINKVEDEIPTGLFYDIKYPPGDDNVVCAHLDTGFEVWDATLGSSILRRRDVRLRPILSPDGRFAVFAGSDTRESTLELWNGTFRNKIADIPGLETAAFSSDGNRVASYTHDFIHILDCVTLKTVAKINKLSETETAERLRGLKFSPNGQLVCLTWCSRGRMQFLLWDITRQESRARYTFSGYQKSVVFSPNSEFFNFPRKEGFVLLETATGKELCVFKGNFDRGEVEFYAGGHLIAILGFHGKNISVWRTAANSRGPMYRLEPSQGEEWDITKMAISTTGKLAALSNCRKDWLPSTILLWDIPTGIKIGSFHLQTSIISDLSFTTDSRYLECTIGKLPGLPPLLDQDVTLGRATETAQNSLYVEKQWMVQNFEKLLWLPLPYRACMTAWKDETFVLGHIHGLMTIIKFDLSKTPLSNRIKQRTHSNII